jgi:electron transfer flavoprotein alpha subunit
MRNVLAILISTGGAFGRTEVEVLSAASRLAAQLGGSVTAGIVGEAAESWNAECFAYGTKKVVRGAGVGSYQPDTYIAAVQQIAAHIAADVALVPSTTYGLEIAPLVAYRLGASITLDCIELRGDSSGRFTITKPVYGGKANSELVASKPPVVIAMRMRAVTPVERQEAAGGEVETVRVDLGQIRPRTRIVERITEQTGASRLEDARVVVSGGRGIGGKENFAQLEELARLLGGTVGASRAACDLGWVPANLQIGQTGKKVAPELYFAVGISGASQHLVGVSGARHIVAINSDAKSPIFQVAELGLVEDWKIFLPKLMEALKRRKQARGDSTAA